MGAFPAPIVAFLPPMRPSRQTTLALSAGVALLAAVVVAWWALAHRGRPQSRGANVLLVSVDTLRADRLGVYGYGPAETPRLDALAGEGIVFEQVVSPMPLTLPAHTSLMTALDTSEHGVRDNGAFEIAAGATTLAEELHTAGYDTGAFVGAFVLHSRWGLDRGFTRYDDSFEYERPGAIPGQVERRAADVVDAALRWLQEPRKDPFFAWVHLYDPHSPYSAPEPWGERFADRPYDGEIAYTDQQIGRLLDVIETAGLGDTITVVTADHGEGLGEHGEPGHGMFLYDTTLLVPLILQLPDGELGGHRVPEQVRLIDVAPTVLELVDVDVPTAFSGRSLVDFLVGRPDSRTAYAETFYPRWHFGWQQLHALRKDGFKYILAPRPELYDVDADPDESHNLAADEADFAASLRNEVEAVQAAAVVAGPGELGAEAAEGLRALGYIGSAPADLPEGPLPDPKDKIGLFRRTSDAQGLLVSGRFAEAETMLEEVVAEDPRIVSAHLTLGNARFRQGDFDGAAEAFEATLELAPDHELALLNLGLAHRRLGERKTARADFEVLLSLDPRNASAHFQLGEMALEEGDPAAASERFEKAQEINDQLPGPHFGLGVAAFQTGRIEDARDAFRRVASLVETYPELHYHLGLIAERRGAPESASRHYRTELENNPGHYRSWVNLSQIQSRGGDHAAAVEALRSGIAAAPGRPAAHILLARSLLALEDPSSYAEIEEHARLGLSRQPPASLRPLGHYVLADVYTRLDRPRDAQRQLQLAREAERALGGGSGAGESS